MNVLDFLFPRRCLGCGKKGKYFCDVCIKKIELANPQISSVQQPLDGLLSLFSYQGIIRQAILKLKYRFVSDLADELINLSFRLNETHFNQFDYSKYIFVPVPLHWQRKNWRGFNQAEVLGKKIAEKLKIKFYPDLLMRTRRTTPQVELKEKQRRSNVRGAFKINSQFKKSIRGKKVLLFDDVWTTGATMQECGRILEKAGAAKVLGMTLAR